MSLIPSLSNREKIILSFLVLLVLLNGLTILVSRNLSGFSYSFQSMLEDRLIPSSDLSKIREEFYKNRLYLEEMIFLPEWRDLNLMQKILVNNQEINQILMKYSKTSLTSIEAASLEKFNRQLEDYRSLEQQVINFVEHDSLEKARLLFLAQSMTAFENLLVTMRDLNNIQVQEGASLYHKSEKMVNTIQMIAYFSIALALMITVNMLKVLRFRIK